MLVEFRVSNFKSIRDEAALSLVASKLDEDLALTHLIPTTLRSVPNVVRTAVIYGPNASGKSTLLFALNYFRSVVAGSATLPPGARFNVQPFRLDPACAKRPTSFELTFLLDNVRHQFAFAMTSEAIVEESLVVFRTSKPTVMYRRTAHAGGDSQYEFSSYLTGPRATWREATKPNSLFLSTAAQLNSEALSPIFRKIVEGILYFPAGSGIDPEATTAMLSNDKGRESIQRFLAVADLSIESVDAVPRKGIRAELTLGNDSPPRGRRQEMEFVLPVFKHVGPVGSASFEFQEESEGTQRLYGFISPVLAALTKGQALIVDELDSSLHTLLVRRLIGMFHDRDLNPHGGQLIFTTHDTSLLDQTIFRRDQVWFTDKDRDHATRLYPLTDFSPRKHEAWERGYLHGRYGGIPVFPGVNKQARDALMAGGESASSAGRHTGTVGTTGGNG